MTDRTGAVYDLGYEPYEGERNGRSGARRTVVADGLRRVLGLRRKGRRKVLPWALLLVAVAPAVVAVGASFLLPTGGSDQIEIVTANAGFFLLGGTIALLFASLAAPELLIPDRSDGVLSMLASRPLTPGDYVAAKFASIAAIVFAFLLVPQITLYVGEAGTHSQGLFAGFVDGADKLPKILLVAGVYTIAYVPLAFVIAALTKRKAVASSIFIALSLGLAGIGETIVRETNFAAARWIALLSPIDDANAVNLWVFDEHGEENLLDYADIHPLFGLLSLVVLGIACVFFVYRRYRRIM
ncbi:MAG: hypothetical protein O3B42_07320 [Actinomycetota bacterium]|nr:hypothetical protein [Actinomycetota bacterium]